MYVIKLDGQKSVHGAGTQQLTVKTPILEVALGAAGSLAFEMSPENVGYDTLIEKRTLVELFVDHDLIWRGRVMQVDKTWTNMKQVECAGVMNCLADTIIPPHTRTATLTEYLDWLIATYNANALPSMVITRGVVDITSERVARTSEDYASIRDLMDDGRKFQEGIFVMRYDEDGNYLDFRKAFPEAEQVINFGQNLLDIKASSGGTKMATVMIPLSRIEGEDDYLTIASVNGGSIRLVNQAAVDMYGWIETIVEYDQVTTAASLLSKSQADLEAETGLIKAITVRALDLSLIDKDIRAFRLGETVRVVSPPHLIDDQLRVSKLRLDLARPEKSELTLGDPLQTLTERR